jgi:hypothetical protein
MTRSARCSSARKTQAVFRTVSPTTVPCHFEVEGRSDEFFWYLKQALGQRQPALKSIGKFWSGKVDGSGGCV